MPRQLQEMLRCLRLQAARRLDIRITDLSVLRFNKRGLSAYRRYALRDGAAMPLAYAAPTLCTRLIETFHRTSRLRLAVAAIGVPPIRGLPWAHIVPTRLE